MQKRVFKFAILPFIILSSNCFAQNRTIDSLLTLLKADKPDTNKVKHLNNLCHEYSNLRLFDTALYHGNAALQLAQKLDFKKGIANSYGQIGTVYLFQTNYNKALENWLLALKIDEELKNKKEMAFILGNIGFIYSNQGNYPKALKYFWEALKVMEELGDKTGTETVLCNIGAIYEMQKDYPKALDYFLKAFKIAKKLGDKKIIALALGNVGTVYDDQKDYPDAQDYYLKALKMSEEYGDKNKIAFHLRDLGNVYAEQNNNAKALDYFFKALKMIKEGGDKNINANTLSIIGSLYIKTGKFKEAEQYLKNALALEDSLGTLNELRQTEESLSRLYDTTGRLKLALIHYKKSIVLKDTLFSQEKNKDITRKEMNFEFDKKEAITKAENEKQQAVAEEKTHRQTVISWSIGGGLLLVIVFAGFVFRSLRITRKQKNIIELQKNKVQEQKHIIEEKQKETVDSINYAKRIQYTLLANEDVLKQNLNEHFILFQPKDIVSGDFYWAAKTIGNRTLAEGAEEKTERFYLAVCDSTGHGVPGAFMSLLNISFLNEAIIEKNITQPDKILNHVRRRLIESISKDGAQDGMDGILICFENYPIENGINSPFSSKGARGIKITYAAANNAPLIVRDNALIAYNADKMPIGKGETDIPFTLRTIDIKKGDTLYLYTDGYADQFGGTKGKKFMYKQLDNLLITINQKSMEEQKQLLASALEQWKGNLEQVDDVLVIGIRI